MTNAHKQAALKRKLAETVRAAQKYRPFVPSGKVYANKGAQEAKRRLLKMQRGFDVQTYVNAYEAAE